MNKISILVLLAGISLASSATYAAPKKSQVAPKKPQATVLPTAKRQPLTVSGRVLTMGNKPLAGVEIGIYGSTMAGANVRFETQTNASGLFSQRVPDGIYGVSAYLQKRFNGKEYKFTLAPEDGLTGVRHSSTQGVVKNFRWKISGLKPGERAGEPGTHTEGNKYYGGYIYLRNQEKGFGGDTVYFPANSTLVIRLTPRGPLIDGSKGVVQTFRKPFTKDEMSGVSWYLTNIPIGLYTASAFQANADNSLTPLNIKLSGDFNGPFKPSANVDFEPTSFGDMQMMQVTVQPQALAEQGGQ